jgi:hypothetical protein
MLFCKTNSYGVLTSEPLAQNCLLESALPVQFSIALQTLSSEKSDDSDIKGMPVAKFSAPLDFESKSYFVIGSSLKNKK